MTIFYVFLGRKVSEQGCKAFSLCVWAPLCFVEPVAEHYRRPPPQSRIWSYSAVAAALPSRHTERTMSYFYINYNCFYSDKRNSSFFLPPRSVCRLSVLEVFLDVWRSAAPSDCGWHEASVKNTMKQKSHLLIMCCTGILLKKASHGPPQLILSRSYLAIKQPLFSKVYFSEQIKLIKKAGSVVGLSLDLLDKRMRTVLSLTDHPLQYF